MKNGKNTFDKGGFVCDIFTFTGLSKDFDTMDHDLLIANIDVYGFEEDSRFPMKIYLTKREQQLRVNNKIGIYVGNNNVWSSAVFNIKTTAFYRLLK